MYLFSIVYISKCKQYLFGVNTELFMWLTFSLNYIVFKVKWIMSESSITDYLAIIVLSYVYHVWLYYCTLSLPWRQFVLNWIAELQHFCYDYVCRNLVCPGKRHIIRYWRYAPVLYCYAFKMIIDIFYDSDVYRHSIWTLPQIVFTLIMILFQACITRSLIDPISNTFIHHSSTICNTYIILNCSRVSYSCLT